MRWHHILLAFAVVVTSLFGQGVLKAGLNQVKADQAAKAAAGALQFVLRVATNLHVLAGFSIMVLGALLYMTLLYFTNFTRALPVMGAISYILIPLYGHFYLSEQITLTQITGLVLLLIAIALISR